MNRSSVYLAILTFSLFPRLVRGYDLVGGLSLFEPSSDWFDEFDTLSSMIRRQQDAFRHSFFRGASALSSPRYEMVNSENQFQVNMDIGDGMTSNDVEVKFDEFQRLLTVSAHKESTNDETGYHFNSQFSRSFSVDPFVQVDQLTATVDNGVLTISAPKDVDRMQHAVRSIPVVKAGVNIAPALEAEEESEPAANASEETKDSGSDPFHVKERVEKAQKALKEEPANKPLENPIEDLLDQEMQKGYKTSELRRR